MPNPIEGIRRIFPAALKTGVALAAIHAALNAGPVNGEEKGQPPNETGREQIRQEPIMPDPFEIIPFPQNGEHTVKIEPVEQTVFDADSQAPQEPVYEPVKNTINVVRTASENAAENVKRAVNRAKEAVKEVLQKTGESVRNVGQKAKEAASGPGQENQGFTIYAPGMNSLREAYEAFEEQQKQNEARAKGNDASNTKGPDINND